MAAKVGHAADVDSVFKHQRLMAVMTRHSVLNGPNYGRVMGSSIKSKCVHIWHSRQDSHPHKAA